MVSIKTQEEISHMREGGKILAEILHELAIATKIGMTTDDLNTKAEAMMFKFNVAPSFKGYHGFPRSLCTSINEEVVHAIPGKRTLNDGDIISIDCGIIHKGMHTDAAVTVMLGKTPERVKKFVNIVGKTFDKIIPLIRPGNHIGDIGNAIQLWIEGNGYSVVRDFIGHGVGRALHEDPEVPNCGKKGAGPILVPGMTIAIEPIIAMGQRFIKTLPDGWTAVTKDNEAACQVEHTFLITNSGNEILTRYNNAINCVYVQ